MKVYLGIYARVYVAVSALLGESAGKNMEVGQIVGGPPFRYCDAIIHRKLSTHGDNLRERATNRSTVILALRYVSSSPAPPPLHHSFQHVCLTCVRTLHNDILTRGTRELDYDGSISS